MTKRCRVLILTVIAALTLALTATSFSSSGRQGAGKATFKEFTVVIITGENIRNLPPGENRLVREAEGRDAGYVGTANGGVWKLTNGGSSVPLTKIGTGTLIFPNTYRGLTHINKGAQNSANNNRTMTKELTGTLVLATDGVVYEFRDLGLQDFGHVVVPTADTPTEDITLVYGEIKTSVQQHRPADAMKGWPFKRLLIGPAKGIAQVEGWKPGVIKASTPGSKYVCTAGRFCACNGTADCLSLADSGLCSSNMNCDGTGRSTRCYCNSK